MADTQSYNYASHTESVGESIITGLTPRDIHLFIRKLVALNAALKSQLAAVNRSIAERRGNTDNASTESVVHSPVQATGQQDSSYTSANQSPPCPSTLANESNGITPVQPESELEAIVNATLEDWEERLTASRLENEPGAPADPQLSYLLREREHRWKAFDELRVLHSNEMQRRIVLYNNETQRHIELEEEFRRQLARSGEQKAIAERDRDALRAREEEVRRQWQEDVGNLNIRIEEHKENIRKLQLDYATSQRQVELLLAGKVQLDNTTKELTGRIEELNKELAKRTNDNSTLKKDLENALAQISSLSEHKGKFEAEVRQSREQAAEEIKMLQQERDSLRAQLEQLPCSEQAAKDMEELQKERDSLREKLEQLQSDSKPTSGEEQKKTLRQLKIKNRELEHKLTEMRKSKEILQTMVEDNTSKLAEMELRGQLDDVKAMLKVCEDLARTRGETIENLKREQSRSIENSETFKALRVQFDACKRALDEQRKKLENESAVVKELQQSSATMQSLLDEITKERDDLRLITMRQRHNPPPAARMSGLVSDADTGSSAAAAAAAAATLPPAFAQPLRQEVATDTGSPRARAATRQSAVQTPSNNRPSSQPAAYRMGPPMIHRCQYCRAEHPDYDSRFVHEKDCPKRPFDD